MKGPGLALICALMTSAALPLAGRSTALGEETPACGGSGPLTYVCGATNVEDMVQVPATQWLIGSSMRLGKAATKDGVAFYLIDTQAKTVAPASIAPGPEPKSGPFAGCPAPDLARLGTHGLELRAGTGGRHILYAINHGGRESIEVFEVQAGADGAAPKIAWSGCIKAPANTWLNSVASLPGGGLAISKFEDLDKIDMGPVFRGETTGMTYIWRPGSGFTELQGARFSGNNGLLASKDGRTLWINDQGRSRIVRLAIDGSTPPAYATVAFRPDNLRWAPDGSILVAGQVIGSNPSLALANGWGVARLDPQTMAVTPLMNEPGRPEFSNGTVAMQVGKTLWLGTFRGDRIAYAEAK